MDFRDTPEEAAFRDEVRTWLAEHFVAPYNEIGTAGPGGREEDFGLRHEWERKLGEHNWIGLAWPKEYGGRGATVAEQVIWHVEYAKAEAPGRIGFFGEGLLGPTLLALGTEEQKQRFLPPILRAEELWCQGYSEPNAGSDLANVATKAVLDGDEWVVNGQKVWTTFAQYADWCFVVTRTDTSVPQHQGISYLLVPMHQEGVTVRPLKQLTGTSEFSEVFFDDARTDADLVVGGVNGGWKTAMTTLSFERGTAMLSQVMTFERELWRVVDAARKSGVIEEPHARQRLAHAYVGVRIMGFNTMRMVTQLIKPGGSGGSPGKMASLGPEASIAKLYWSRWHQGLGELAMELLGPAAMITPGDAALPAAYDLDDLQRSFLFARAETIYAGSSEIQKNIIGERVLGLPRDAR